MLRLMVMTLPVIGPFVIMSVFIMVAVIRLMPVIVEAAVRALIFFPVVKPFVIPMLFIPVSAGRFPVVLVAQVFTVFGNGKMDLLGFFVAPVFFGLRPG